MRIAKTILFISIFLIGMFVGSYVLQGPTKNERIEISSENILTLLKGEGFLVTETYIFDQHVDITQSTGSAWKDIFWQQYTQATGKVKVSVGVDLSELTIDDVVEKTDSFQITLPPLDVYSVEIIDGIDVKNKEGILKRVVDHDDGYQLAFDELKEQARTAAGDQTLVAEAGESTKEELANILGLVTDKDIVILLGR